jgi:hypothetical protein
MRLRTSLLVSAALSSAVGASLFAAQILRADELKLKDGTKISGTIVGFEENSFKVKTSYGFAEVQKDQVVSISITAAKTEASPAPAAEAPKPETANAAPVISKPVIKAAPAAKPVSAPKLAAANPSPIATTPVADPAPPKPAAPVPIREEVVGNLYTNDTYRFQMYKPPGWQMIAGARKLLPGTITALGTDDETTYLLIGQELAGDSLTSDIKATEQRLRDVMDNFRPLAEEHVMIGGLPAVEHHFRGEVDDHDWSGVAVFIPRGTHIYTIFGMTLADSDLVQIQENVIDRAITSLQFTEQ